jgi:hypothetical protein
VSSAKPSVSNAVPLPGFLGSSDGIFSTAKIKPAIPIGTPIRKIVRQSSRLSMIQPLIVGPIEGASIIPKPQTPSARPRCCGGTTSMISAIDVGETRPPPIACRIRNPMMLSGSHASDARIDAPVKIARPVR